MPAEIIRSAMRMASAGMRGEPRKPNLASASSHVEVPLNWSTPKLGTPLLSGRTMFTPWLSHWMEGFNVGHVLDRERHRIRPVLATQRRLYGALGRLDGIDAGCAQKHAHKGAQGQN